MGAKVRTEGVGVNLGLGYVGAAVWGGCGGSCAGGLGDVGAALQGGLGQLAAWGGCMGAAVLPASLQPEEALAGAGGTSSLSCFPPPPLGPAPWVLLRAGATARPCLTGGAETCLCRHLPAPHRCPVLPPPHLHSGPRPWAWASTRAAPSPASLGQIQAGRLSLAQLCPLVTGAAGQGRRGY